MGGGDQPNSLFRRIADRLAATGAAGAALPKPYAGLASLNLFGDALVIDDPRVILRSVVHTVILFLLVVRGGKVPEPV